PPGGLWRAGDAVSPPEPVLQPLEPAREAAQPLLGLAAGKQRGEEVSRIAQLLDGDAQLVAPVRVELHEPLRPLAHLLQPPRQLLAGEVARLAPAPRLDQLVVA